MGAPHLAAVLGASGNVGKALVSELSAHEAVSRIILINRRDVPEVFSHRSRLPCYQRATLPHVRCACCVCS
jgi:hypothetical protein